MFLSNNVKFSSLNDVVSFIDNVRMDMKDYVYDDYAILDRDKFISITQCFEKIVMIWILFGKYCRTVRKWK